MKRYLAVLALVCSTVASAGELEEANKLLESKAYPQAMSLYTKLANQGNAQAQFHLGEMYWYGEAGKIDVPLAKSWFEKAAAGGSKEAGAALATMQMRATRAADIAYWTGSYDGAALTSGKNACAAPVFPALSKENEDIKTINRQYQEWSTCYQQQVAHLQSAAAPVKVIPADVADLMNQQEFEQASARVDQVNARVAREIGASAEAVIANYDKWRTSTQAYVNEQNRLSRIENERMVQRRQEIQRQSIVGPMPTGIPTYR
jgi:hypothetical protein